MFSKRSLPKYSDQPKEKRLRTNIEDLYFTNQVSAERASSLLQDAEAAGSAHTGDLHSFKPSAGHHKRDLQRKLVRYSNWPKPYFVSVEVWDPKKKAAVHKLLPMWLPHELVGYIAKRSSLEIFLDKGRMSVDTAAHVTKVEAQAGATLLGCGLWCDGVPYNWDKSSSLEVVALNFPGVPEWKNMRLPITVIDKSFVIKHATFDCIFNILKWSFEILFSGVYPSRRHDGSPFTVKDAVRKKLAGQTLYVRAILAEVRGDWACYKELFRLPGWKELSGCCWRCTMTPDRIHLCDDQAFWRMPQHRLSHWQFMTRQAELERSTSPIMGCPFVDISIFQIDWLHAVDKGVAADFCGSVLSSLLPKMRGTNKDEQCRDLFLKLQTWYKDNGTKDRLANLTATMLQKKASNPPKLRGGAAQVRATVPFVNFLAQECCRDDNVWESSLKAAAGHLSRCYECLDHQNFSIAVLKEHCRKFCTLYAALVHDSDHAQWRLKPKLHLFQEMCEMAASNPSLTWTYRDEDFGGALALMGRRRGGPKSVTSTAENVLRRFAGRHDVPAV